MMNRSISDSDYALRTTTNQQKIIMGHVVAQEERIEGLERTMIKILHNKIEVVRLVLTRISPNVVNFISKMLKDVL